MESLLDVATVLQRRGLEYIPDALIKASVEFREEWEGFTTDNVYHVVATAVVTAPFDDYDYLISLHSQHKQLILKTIQEVWPVREDGTELTFREIEFRLDRNSLREDSDDAEDLTLQLEWLKSTLIAVSTGGPRIDDVNPEYKDRYFRFTTSLRSHGLENPIPYADLWDWYGKWSSGDLPSWQSRREYIRGLFGPLERRLREGPLSGGTKVFSELTGWPRVDRTLGEIRSQLERSRHEEQFQSVGLLCREALISLAQTVFNPYKHPPLDDTHPSGTDAKRMLQSYLAVELGGSSNSNARKHARAALDFANDLQHRRTAKFRDAALCAEATASVVNIVAIVSGIRDPE